MKHLIVPEHLKLFSVCDMSYNFLDREDLYFKTFLYVCTLCWYFKNLFSRYFRIFPFWRNQPNVPGEITIEITEKNLLPGENLKKKNPLNPFLKARKSTAISYLRRFAKSIIS